jgi:hypothetical protein
MKPGIAPVAQKPRQVRTNIIALIFINFKSANIILNFYSKSIMLKINTTDTSNFILLFVTLRSLGFANEPSGLICIIPNSRSVALLNNGGEFIFPFKTMNFVFGKVKAVSRQSDTQKTVKIHLGDVEMKIEPDSGADVNLMDEFHFTNLRKLYCNHIDQNLQ